MKASNWSGAGRTPGRGNLDTGMDPVEVFCRLRPAVIGPTNSQMADRCVKKLNDFAIQLSLPAANTSSGVIKGTQCLFTHVFDESSAQKDVFNRVAFDLVEDLIRGKNGLLFTYGVTGSGKTYTMTGHPKEIGILPRCLDVLFNSIKDYLAQRNVFQCDPKTNVFDVQPDAPSNVKKMKTQFNLMSENAEWEFVARVFDSDRVRAVEEDNVYGVFVSYIQIYNNAIYDLLDKQGSDKPRMGIDGSGLPQSKTLREDSDHNMYVYGVTEIEVKTTEEALRCFVKGQEFRKKAPTALNAESSRSHSVFNIRVVQSPLDQNGRDVLRDRSKIHVSQLSLVDLAGSERSSRTGNVGDRMRETGHINESLMTLRQCIEHLRENQKCNTFKMVPYRNCKLTHLFKNYFEGRGKVRMVVCVNPLVSDYDENRHVLEFAEMTQEVEVPRATATARFGFGEPDDPLALTPGRRRAAALLEEAKQHIDKKLTELGIDAVSKLPNPPNFSLFFEPTPNIRVTDITADSDTWIVKLRQHFNKQFKRHQELATEATQKRSEFEASLRKFVIDHMAMKQRYETEVRVFSDCEKENRRLRDELRETRQHVTQLELDLSRLQRDAALFQGQEDERRKRELELAAQMRQKEEKLRQVKQIFTRPNQTQGPPYSPPRTFTSRK